MNTFNRLPFKHFTCLMLILCVGCGGGSGSSNSSVQDTNNETPSNNDIPEIIKPTPNTTPNNRTRAPKENEKTPPNKLLPNSPKVPLGKMPSFPGAKGFGAFVTGGRGGKVIKITNLNANGKGSLQDALNQNEPRIIVFDVAGVITANVINIRHGNVTIAGQTAPGAGITIEGRLYGAYSPNVKNIIIRHIKVRPPIFNNQTNGNQFDAVQLSRNTDVILDHVSMSFGVDETLDIYSAKNVTIQWSTIEQSAIDGHPKNNHNYGLINGPDGARVSILNNLFAHHNRRAPSLSSGPTETINNVIYNVKDGWLHSGNKASGQHIVSNNYFRRGPSSSMTPLFLDASSIGSNLGYYFNNNYVDDPGNLEGVIEPWATRANHSSLQYFCSYFNGDCTNFRLNSRPNFSSNGNHIAPSETNYTDAYNNVLNKAGAFPRDSVTKASVQETRSRSGSWGARIPSNLLRGLTPGVPPLDTDNDGIPDDWETNNGLDLSNAGDVHSVMRSGYPAIEQYINEVADNLIR